ncbi:MAG: 5'-nucleotidase C-terminal domain-containing protein [Geminicoccaceae bacterium]
MAHLLFLSHAGADTERALRLAAAIEASPNAQAAGLKVWLDKRPDGPHRLNAGTPWQDQLERAIAADSTAFGLLLTREGARNWVRLEVRVALDRVIAEQRAGTTYPFVPIIADDPADLAHLPPFAQQYQGVRLTGDGQGLADLVRVAARLDAAQPVRLVAQPFMGLEAFEAKDAALFFGRRAETQALVDRLRTTNLVLVTGDSGSGKSSLVKAGLIPAFREGALADPLGRRPEPGQWHVVEMRPGTDPFEGLVEGVGKAASAAGKSLADQGTLNDWVRTRDPDKIRDALRQSGPDNASLLLVVDQFEELWTLTLDDTKRRDFLAALLALAPEGDLTRRVVGTMRRDYYHLHTDDDRLRDRLAAHGNAGRFLLGAMAPEALRDIVEKPLLLAGESETRAAALADEVVKDVAGEPGNLALVEMALHESWERRHESGGDLALAYQRLDRLEGALARAAEEVFWNPSNNPTKLTERERPIAETLFMRLVRAGDAGGATRRLVHFAELAEPARAVARKLGTAECRRLLVLRILEPSTDDDAATVELAHEQLVTQWPDYRFWLRGTATGRYEPDPVRAADKRVLDRVIDAAAAWDHLGREDVDLARGGELTEFSWLRTARFRDTWLSDLERKFIERSINASLIAERERQQQVETLRQLARTRKHQIWGAMAASILLTGVTAMSVRQWNEAELQRQEAELQRQEAETQKRLAEDRFDSLQSLGNVSVVTTHTGLDSRRSELRLSESSIGNLVADAIRMMSASDVSIISSGIVRGDYIIPPGSTITVNDLLLNLPFSNKIVSIKLSGIELVQALERAFSALPEPSTRFPQISGMKVIVDAHQPPGSRLAAVKVGNEELKLEQEYNVSTTDYNATGGDFIFDKDSTHSEHGSLLAALASYILAHGAADAQADGRIDILPSD